MKFVIVWLIFINLFTFILYAADKARAKKRRRRISERALLIAAAVGGSFGALLAMLIFHHKTRHPEFYIGVPAIMLLQIIIIVCYYLN